MNNLYIALVHYPVYNKNRKVVCTSITNLDIHDIARTSKTYNLRKFFIINPQSSQKEIFSRLRNFWETDVARKYNVARFNAFKIIEFVSSIAEVKQKIADELSVSPVTFTTSANNFPQSIKYSEAANLIKRQIILIIIWHSPWLNRGNYRAK